MKGKNLKNLFNSKRFVKTGSVLLAAVVLGAGAWSVDLSQRNEIPEFTTFVDLDDQISIGEDEVPLASAPKVSVKTKTTKKVVSLKKKSSKTYTKKLKPKKVKSPTITRKSKSTTTTTKKETTTYVTEKYKKNSKKKTVLTTQKIKTTVTTVKKSAPKPTVQNPVNTTVNTADTQTVGKSSAPYTVDAAVIASKLDARALKALQELKFTITIDGSASYAGYFDARSQSIILREESDTVYHEVGHFVAFLAGNVDMKPEFSAVYREEKDRFTGSRRVYAMQNPSEFFAETFREYTLNPAILKNTCPKTYEAISNALDKLTDGQISQMKMIYGI